MTNEEFDRRLNGVTETLELVSRDLEQMKDCQKEMQEQQKQDTANIHSLMRMVELHEHRIRDLEG